MSAAMILETGARSAAAVCAETRQQGLTEQGWELLWLVQRVREQ